MPKAQSPSERDPAPYKQNINSLRRNQACHQCRKRKLKCDARRPCSTCVRSHAYALSHAAPAQRAGMPQRPDCTYDEVAATLPAEQAPPAPKTRYEKLECRINELEALLREKSVSSTGSPSSSSNTIASVPSSNTDATSINSNHDDFGLLPSHAAPSPSPSMMQTDWANMYFVEQSTSGLNNQAISQLGNGNPLEGLAGLASMMQGSTPQTTNITAASTPSPDMQTHTSRPSMSPAVNADTIPSPMSEMDQSLFFIAWPPNLPDPAMTRHLIQAFFSHCVHATRMFHAPSFFAALSYHPTDPGFPVRSVLHMMCAIGSMYTSSFPIGSVIESYPYDPMNGTKRTGSKRTSTFASQQARYARDAIDDALEIGERLFENSQSRILLTWYYYSQARWIDSCLSSAMSMRSCVTMALNVCPPFQGLSATDSGSERPPSVLSPPKSIIEDEMRRNMFWIAYSMDRQTGAGNGWAMNIDDLDIQQLLPLRHDQWEQGILVSPYERQYSHGKDTLTKHPSDQADPFIFYCKATMLMSRVKNFCLRFRSLRYVGDPSVRLPDNLFEVPAGTNSLVIRDTPGFVQLNNLIQIMKTACTQHMKHYVEDGKLEVYSYCTWNTVHLAQIHLHEPFAKPGSDQCTSALAILTASRAIVDSLHVITSTSFDVSLLDTMAFLCWYMAGRVLTRFLKAAQDNQAVDQLVPLKAEVAFIRGMLLRAGERIPLAYCYWKMLVRVIEHTGVEVAEQEVYFPHMSPPIVPQFQFAMAIPQTAPGVPVPA